MHIIQQFAEISEKVRGESEPSGHVELELRVKNADQKTVADLYQSLRSKAADYPFIKFECTTQIISPVAKHHKNLRNVMIRNRDHATGKIEFRTKTTMARSIEHLPAPHVISIAVERSAAPFQPDRTSMVRFKTRASFEIKSSRNWRIDITASRQGSLANIGPARDLIVAEMFTHPEELFVQGLSSATGWEIELEWQGGMGTGLTVEEWNVAANTLFNLINSKHAANIERELVLSHVRQLLGKSANTPFSSIVNQVKTLDRTEWNENIYPADGWWVTDKADGRRVLLFISDERWHVISSSDIRSGTIRGAEGSLVLDCEETQSRLYAFDCLYYYGRPLNVLESRIAAVTEVVNSLGTKMTTPLHAKTYTQITAVSAGKTIKSVWEMAQKSALYECDGLILSSPTGTYAHTVNYKWKPAEMNTIDFLVLRVPDTVRSSEPYLSAGKRAGELYVLFVKIDTALRDQLALRPLPGASNFQIPPIAATRGAADYEHVPFTPAAWPLAYLWSGPPDLNGRVVELVRLPTGDWKYIRTREDKTEGNGYVVAESNFSLYIDPFPVEDFGKEPTGSVVLEIWRPVLRAKRVFTAGLFEKWFSGEGSTILDLSLSVDYEQYFRPSNLGRINLVAVNHCRDSLAALTRNRLKNRTPNGPNLTIIAADTSGPFRETAELIRREAMIVSVDYIYCNRVGFANGTGGASAKELRNFFALCASQLRAGGYMILTSFTAEGVSDLAASLENSPFEMRISPGAADRWIMPRPNGRVVEVVIPSARNILAQAKLAGLSIVKSGPFTGNESLTPAEDKYLLTNMYYLFTKKRDSKSKA